MTLAYFAYCQVATYDHTGYGGHVQQQPALKDYQQGTSKYAGGAAHTSQAHAAYNAGQATGYGSNIAAATASTSTPLAAAAQQQVSNASVQCLNEIGFHLALNRVPAQFDCVTSVWLSYLWALRKAESGSHSAKLRRERASGGKPSTCVAFP